MASNGVTNAHGPSPSQQHAGVQLAVRRLQDEVTSDQSYKHFMIVNYDSRVVPDLKIPHITTLEL